jgi:hypothetical protein
VGWPAGGGQLGFPAAFFIVCLNQGHFFSKSFLINFYDFIRIYFYKISWGERKSGVASLGWLQSSLFIVCLNQGHFFTNFFSINFYDFFPNFFGTKYHGERGRVRWPAGGGQLGFG